MASISFASALNLLSISALLREEAMNQFQIMDQSLVVGPGDIINMIPLKETNKDEATGSLGATEAVDLGRTYSLSTTPKYTNFNYSAFVDAYGMGQTATVAAGTGYRHTTIPRVDLVDDQRSVPTFTSAQRLGGGTSYLRVASGMVTSFTETFTPGEPVTLAATMLFSGKYDRENLYEEKINDLDNVTEITLTTLVPGATAEERLANAPNIRVEFGGTKNIYINPVAVSAADPAVVTIASLGGVGDTVTYKVLHRFAATSWLPQPAIVEEPTIKANHLFITFDGTWDGTEFLGGRTVCSDLASLAYVYTNEGLEPEQTPCGTDVEQLYAGKAIRSSVTEVITLTIDAKDILFQEMFNKNDVIGFHWKVEGELFPGDTEGYLKERVFPRCTVMDVQVTSNDGNNQQVITLEPLYDASIVGTTQSITQNLVATYAA